MATPEDHNTFQARTLKHAEAIGSTTVLWESTEEGHCLCPEASLVDGSRNRSHVIDYRLGERIKRRLRNISTAGRGLVELCDFFGAGQVRFESKIGLTSPHTTLQVDRPLAPNAFLLDTQELR